MNIIKADNFCQAYQRIIHALVQKKTICDTASTHDSVSPRGQLTHELFNCIINIENPKENLFRNSIREPKYKYLAGELIWYFSGRDDVQFISNYSNVWSSICDRRGRCNSAYGARIFVDRNEAGITEWQWAQHCLVNDTDTRQAILHFNKPIHAVPGTKDFVCTLTAAFHIRYGMLHMSVNMRSQDVFWGIVYDIPFFTLLQQLMVAQLNRVNPDLKLKVGTYTHYVHSLHMYDRNSEILTKSINNSTYSDDKLPELTRPELFLDLDGSLARHIHNISLGVVDNDLVKTDPLYNWIVTHSEINK